MNPLRITFQNPPAFEDPTRFIIPYNELILRSSIKTLIESGQVELSTSVNAMRDSSVLLLSAYVWNWKQIKKLAQTFKQVNSSGLVVVGGPNISYNQVDFFQNNPEFDMITTNEMEIIVPRILKALLTETQQPIPGVRTAEGFGPPLAEKWNWDDGSSCYLDNADYVEHLLSSPSVQKQNVLAVWETVRGCPYKCSFCDWGGYTHSRLRAKPITTIENEIEFFASMGVDQVNCIDANFGIIKRDQEIIERVGKTKLKFGKPQIFTWVPTKSSVRHVKKIASLSRQYDLDLKVIRLDLQSTDQKILNNTDRENISNEKMKNLISDLKNTKSVGTGLIMGLPGETLLSFKKTIFDCIELGIHEDFEIYNFSLLPNSPANSSSYRSRFKLETISRIMHSESLEDPREQGLSEEEIVVSTLSYLKTDWIDFYLWKCFIEAFHKLGLIRLIALSQTDLPLFYHRVFEEVFKVEYKDIYDAVYEELHQYVFSTKTHNKIYLEKVGYLDPEDWTFLELVKDYDQLLHKVATLFDVDPTVLELQSKSFILPNRPRTETFDKINPFLKNEKKIARQFQHPELNLKEYILRTKKRLYRKEESNVFAPSAPIL